MLASISPVGEATRGNRWGLTAAAYLVGSAVGGVAVGGLLGAAGSLLTTAIEGGWTALALAAAAGLGLLVDRRGVPTLHRQVDERWLTSYRGWVYGVGFGFQLGGGVATTVTSSATYVVLLGATLTGSWWAGAVIVGCFGTVRALPLLATVRVRDAARLRALHRRLEGWTGPVAGATSIAQAGLAALAVLTWLEVAP